MLKKNIAKALKKLCLFQISFGISTNILVAAAKTYKCGNITTLLLDFFDIDHFYLSSYQTLQS